jgi:type II secretory pathway pseudopilin PulG
MPRNIRNLSQARQFKTYFELKKLASQNPQAGFTIIESLMAIIVVTILLIGITPPIFLVVGTRVQNQRAEQAMQLAQREVDKVRVLMERGDFNENQLPPMEGMAKADTVAAPQNLLTARRCTDVPPAVTLCSEEVNEKIEGDDFFIQKFRTREERFNGQVIGFNMGVRVYSRSAALNPDRKETQEASLKMTSADGSQRRFPLAVIYTTVVRGDRQESLDSYRQMLQRP